jgi:hypothetical protein
MPKFTRQYAVCPLPPETKWFGLRQGPRLYAIQRRDPSPEDGGRTYRSSFMDRDGGWKPSNGWRNQTALGMVFGVAETIVKELNQMLSVQELAEI